MTTRLTALLLSLLFTTAALALDQVVTDPGDNGGPNQFRARLAALENSGGGRLSFNIGTATIVLTQGALVPITANTIIDGGGKIEISGNNAMRIFVVRAGAVLTLSNMTLSHANSIYGDGGAVFNIGTLNINNCKFLFNSTSADWSGSAIYSEGPLNITNSEFGFNTGGGGAFKTHTSTAVATLVRCFFHDNQSTGANGGGFGGAMQIADGAAVTISNSTFNKNTAVYGGAIDVAPNASLIVSSSSFSNNSADSLGGAIKNGQENGVDTSVTISDSSFTTNNAAVGGGIYVAGSGTLVLKNSVVSGNSATASGGGIFSHGAATLTNVSVSDNSTNTPDGPIAGFGGGGIFSYPTFISSSLILTNVTLSNNSANLHGYGGAIDAAGNIILTNVTLSSNSAAQQGGAIYCDGTWRATATLTNVTVVGNSASEAGGIYLFGSHATATVKNTIFAKGASGANSNVAFGGSFNLSDDGSCGFGDGDNVQNLLLGPLANNGGFTKTHLPQPGSRAIDNGKASDPPPRDQRGFVRVGAAPDVGAAEAGGFPAPRSDFDRDDFTDYLLFDSSNRTTAIWYLHNNVFSSALAGPTLPPGWTLIGSGDFDLDGAPDYLLVNLSTHQTAIWYLDNAKFVGGSYGPTLSAGWDFVTAADLNSDGRPDYIFFNSTTRQTAVWFLNGTTFNGGAYGPSLPAGWTLIDVVDFNADNKPDYVLFNRSTRQSAIWYLNGAAFSRGVYGAVLPVGWVLHGASDFNHDGKPDYSLFEPATLRTAIWYLNGPTFVRGVFGPTVPANYTLVVP